MLNEDIILKNDAMVFGDSDGYCNVDDYFNDILSVAKPLVISSKILLHKMEKMLSIAPAFISLIKETVPVERLEAILTDEQKKQIAEGALKLMTKKDGSLLASLVNTETNKIAAQIPLKNVSVSPEFAKAMTSFETQMQMAEIAEQIRQVQVAIEEVRQGQETDRLAMAHSCQQKFLQATRIKNPELKMQTLMRIAMDAEDSRNLLMLSQKSNIKFIKEQPESFFGKLFSNTKNERIDVRMGEIRDSLSAINMVSLTEALVYHEMGETEAAMQSLKYYTDYIHETYLSQEKLVERLDMLDPSPDNYWSQALPLIDEKIKALPYYDQTYLLED